MFLGVRTPPRDHRVGEAGGYKGYLRPPNTQLPNPQALTLLYCLCAPLSLRWPHTQRHPHSPREQEHSTL